MRELMEASEIRESHREGDTRVQDPYCIPLPSLRWSEPALTCSPWAARTLQIEANAATGQSAGSH